MDVSAGSAASGVLGLAVSNIVLKAVRNMIVATGLEQKTQPTVDDINPALPITRNIPKFP